MHLCRLCVRLVSRSTGRVIAQNGGVAQRRLVSNGALIGNRLVPSSSGVRVACSAAHHARYLSSEATQKKDDTPTGTTGERREFQAETRQLLDIVARSLYSEKEVFVRELISNASDALEKLRYIRLSKEGGADPDNQAVPLEIKISTDLKTRSFVIQDNGIGMTKSEMIENLGTIAKSGSKAFIEELESKSKDSGRSESMDTIIGQFGVGFYSSFMVADKVEVVSRSYQDDNVGHRWWSDGSGFYEMQELTGEGLPPVGTKICVSLKSGDSAEYADADVIQRVVQKYSNFVSAPILLNDQQINSVGALWCADPKEITESQHDQFYKFVSHRQHDRPRYTIQYKTDAPINIRALLYVPTEQPSPFVMARDDLEPGVSLYSRRVLIQAKTDKLLPRWLRFMKGVVDSEDIPLNLSRELLQQGALISKLRQTLTNRVIRQFQNEMKKDITKYKEFFQDYSVYFKEAIAFNQDQAEKEDVSKLLLFESSNLRENTQTSLTEYVARMQDEQKDIYYLCAPNRQLAETSPYLELMKEKNSEILFAYEPADEIVLMQLRQFDGKNLTSVEKWLKQHEDTSESAIIDDLSSSDRKDFLSWIQLTLGSRRADRVKAMSKDSSYPCIVTTEDMGAARHFLRTEFDSKLSPQARLAMLKPTLEVNSAHPIMRKLARMKKSEPILAELLIEQLYDNALVTAGLMTDSRPMVGRLNKLLTDLLQRNDSSTGQILTP